MTKLEKKLEAAHSGCDQFEGKTIAKAIRERGGYWLRFTDGTWCHTDYERDIGELINSCDANFRAHPFARLGICDADEIEQHIEKRYEQIRLEEKQERRKLYERLKREFEGN